MKIQLFKMKLSLCPIVFLILLTTSACIDINPKSNDNTGVETFDKNLPKEVKEVILEDNGAVVPMPRVRRMVLRLKNAENMSLSYSEQNGDGSDETQNDVAINDNAREAMRDEIDKIVEFAEDRIDVKAGKLPCVGMNSLIIAVVYNTGDTSRFAVTGSARCDPSLYPSVWALDSMATEMFRLHKSNRQ